MSGAKVKAEISSSAAARAAMVEAGLTQEMLAAQSGIRRSKISKLETAVNARADALGDWLATVEADVRTQAANPAVAEAIERFTAAWTALGPPLFTSCIMARSWFVPSSLLSRNSISCVSSS